jgi:hypothetical protein
MRQPVSILLAAAFVIVSMTGINLLIEHGIHGIRHSGEFHLTARVHEIAGVVFIVTGLVHIKLNFKALLSYMRK